MSVYTQSAGINGSNPVTVGGVGATVKFSPALQNIVVPSVGANQGTNMIIAPLGNNASNGRILKVRACENYSFSSLSASPTFTVGLYAVTFTQGLNGSISAPSAPALITSATEAAASEQLSALPWSLSFELSGDTGSGLVQYNGYISMDGSANGTNGVGGLAAPLAGTVRPKHQ
jgi:hypothetical protein